MAVYKGGRGVQVPYATKMMRVPEPIKDQIQKFIDAYRASVSEGFSDVEAVITDLSVESGGKPLSKDEAIEKAKQIFNSRKSARVSMQKLLTAIYGEKIVLDSE